ncbi:MAG: MATE family efflux transporter [Lachnotalea sp.]
MKSDFTKGSVVKNILSLALPMTMAQFINVLYNIVDRIYIGKIAENATLSLTGLGLAFPIITIIIAFANLIGMGGTPLFSIERGNKNEEEASFILGNSFCVLLLFAVILTVLIFIFKRPLLYLFGASNATFPFANSYLTIYLFGTMFVLIGLGMNGFINAQGFGRIGMFSVVIGAITNIILDPIFIFALHMGIQGAALATVISQALSAIWIIRFLTGNKTTIKIQIKYFKLNTCRIKKILGLGLSGFIMSITNGAVQIMCNATLQNYGGDLYVGVMTVINSIREVISMPVMGITNSAQPIIGYNYGAKEYDRVKTAIKFMSAVCISYTLLAWGIINLFPEFFIQIFNSDTDLVNAAIPALKVYYFGFFMMSLQFSGQSVFVALGKSKQSVFFSLLRKAIIVIPLTLILPKVFHLGTTGVFLAEPISNFIGGLACFTTMLIIVMPELKQKN